jgi:hypothetical protein
MKRLVKFQKINKISEIIIKELTVSNSSCSLRVIANEEKSVNYYQKAINCYKKLIKPDAMNDVN